MKIADVFILAIAALSGCDGQVLTARREAEVQRHVATCQKDYGTKIGTDAFSQCMMLLDAQSQQRRMAAAAMMSAAGQGFNNAAAQHRMTNCTYTPGYGGTVTSQCY